jgi:Tfp pilus assembly protein PilO
MMSSIRFKKNLLLTLIASAVILIAANIFLKSDLLTRSSDEDTIDEVKISQRFLNILAEFDIENKFIKENKVKDKHSNEEFTNFKVQVPKDLTIPEILKEIFQEFSRDSLIIQSFEKVKGSKTKIALKIESSIVLQAEFDYAKNYSRNNGYLAFIINDVDPARETIITLIESPTKINLLIRPETKHLQQLEFIRNNGQQFSVLIDDDINEQKYKLGKTYSEQRVVTVIKTLVTDFQKAVCFIVDENSNFYNSPNYEILNRELSKRKIKLFQTSDFVNLANDETILNSFNDHVEALVSGGSIIFLVSEDSYAALNPEIKKYKKKGYRVITSSLIL